MIFSSLKIRTGLMIIGFFGGAAVILVLVILPFLAKIQEAQAQIATSLHALKKLEAEIQSARKLSQELEQVKDLEKRLSEIFPAREEMKSAVEKLEEAASEAEVSHELKIIDYFEETFQKQGKGSALPPVPVFSGLSQLEEVPYSLEISSDYPELLTFFWNLNQKPSVTEVKQIKITADTEDAGEGKLRNTGSGVAKIEGIFFIRQTP